MTEKQAPEPGRQAHTHGSDQRPPRELWATLRAFDSAEVAARLRAESAFRTDGRNAETVHHDDTARVVVSVVAADREVGAERSDEYVTLTLTDGQGELRRGDEVIPIAAGTTAIVAPGATWSFQAARATTFVICAWRS